MYKYDEEDKTIYKVVVNHEEQYSRSGLQIGRILLDGETWGKVDSSPNALPISKRCEPI
jgi:hypothetical protein